MSLIPPQFLNTIVSFHSLTKMDPQNDVFNMAGVATGFLAGYPLDKSNEQGELYKVFLVTNRHVYHDENGKALERLLVRFNDVGDDAHYFFLNLLDEKGSPIWVGHDEDRVDVAIVPIDCESLRKKNVVFEFYCGDHFMFANEFEKNNITTGDGLFVLGFPMGISGEKRNYAIVRSGIVARVDDELLAKGHYYIDASVYEGNSGGPVIHKPETLAIQGTRANGNSGLMGMISSVTRFRANEDSQYEATGLAQVVPVERICEVMKKVVGDPKTKNVPIRVQVGVAEEKDSALPIEPKTVPREQS